MRSVPEGMTDMGQRNTRMEIALAVLKSCTESSLPLDGEVNQLRAWAEDEQERNLSPDELACAIIQRELQRAKYKEPTRGTSKTP